MLSYSFIVKDLTLVRQLIYLISKFVLSIYLISKFLNFCD